MNKRPAEISGSFNESKKIYVVLIGAAPMNSIDALMLSLERFKGILSSDSAKDRFETVLRTVKTNITDVNQFIESVYIQKNPTMSVSMKGFTLIIEIGLTKEEFLDSVNYDDVEEILRHIISVGTMPAKKATGQKIREYTFYPVKYIKGQFVKF